MSIHLVQSCTPDPSRADLSAADYLAALRNDARFYRQNAEAHRRSALADDAAAERAEALAQTIESTLAGGIA